MWEINRKSEFHCDKWTNVRQAKLSIRSVSVKAILSHEARRPFIQRFTIKQGKYSVLMMRQGVVFSVHLAKFMWGRKVIYNLFPNSRWGMRDMRGVHLWPQILRWESWHRSITNSCCWPYQNTLTSYRIFDQGIHVSSPAAAMISAILCMFVCALFVIFSSKT